MATNENVNKVIYGNQTVMDITDTTAEESDVASGEVFYKANGARSVGTLNADSAVWGNITGTLSNQTDLQTELNRAYTKTASETSSIDDLDVIPVQKISASSDGRRNIKFKNLKSILKTYFDAIYSTFSGSYNDLTNKPTAGTGIAINNNIIAVDADNTPTEGSEKPVKSKGVYSALESSESTQESLLKSTVGWTGKNLLPNDFPNQTINGVTCTKDVNGIINLNGICTGDTYRRIYKGNIPNGTYIISDNVQNHSDCSIYINATKLDGTTVYSIADTINKPTLNADNTLYKEYDIGLYLKNGIQFSNLKVYPMIRDASITDDTYEPYHESVEEEIEQIYADNGVLGAKNLLVNERGNSTIEGVTFVVNADGTVTVSGTPSNNNAYYNFYNPIRPIGKIPAGRYILSGTPSGIDTTKYNMFVEIGGQEHNLYDFGNGVTFDYNGTDTLRFVIGIRTSAVSNLTFKPMLRLASDPDDTYVPYAMTNRELTEAIASVPTVNNGTLTIQQNGTNKATFTANQSGNATANIITDSWTETKTVSSSGTVTFTGLNDSYGYSRPYYDLPSGDSAYTYSKVSKSGSGTSVTLTYTTDAPIGTVCKLRILK